MILLSPVTCLWSTTVDVGTMLAAALGNLITGIFERRGRLAKLEDKVKHLEEQVKDLRDEKVR